MKNEKKLPEANCESCIHYVYDEIYFAYTCDQALDQDELSSYTYNPQRRCPFYQYKDEYINVRKQI
jgi:hypothetical protein